MSSTLTSKVSQLSQAKPAGNTKTAGNMNQMYRWFFTIPYEAISASQLSQDLNTFAKKFLFSGEIGSGGYKHWQGCMSLKQKMYFATVKNIFPTSAHIEPCKDWFKALNYCKKEETHIEGPYTETSSFIKLPPTLKKWQQQVVDICITEPDDRSIYWIWEPDGNTGKTTLCKYLAVKHGATVLNNCSTKDGAYALPDEPKLVVVNLTRSNEGHINYGLLEAIKDGLIFSAKYESKMKCFNSPHVFVFANHAPDETKMSADRWKIYRMKEFIQ